MLTFSTSTVAIIVLVVGSVAVFAGRIALKSLIEGQVRLGIEAQTERLRSEIRQSEERLKSELRTKESELASLRDGVLSGRASRMALIDKRRIEGAEGLWLAVTKLTRMKGPAMTLSVLKFDAIAERVPTDPKLRQVMEMMSETLGGKGFEEKMAELKADEHRPFVSELSWALYSAYAAIILTSWAVLKILAMGVENPDKMLKRDYVNDLLKTVLPHRSGYIDEHKEAAQYYLLDELEKNILTELKRSLHGADADQENIDRSSAIMNEVSKVTQQTEKLDAAVVGE